MRHLDLRFKLNTTFFLLMLCLAVFAGLAFELPGPHAQDLLLLKPASESGTAQSRPDPTVIRSRNVTIDVQMLRSSGNQRLIVPLFNNESMTIIRTRQESTRKDGFVWIGKVANDPKSMVSFSVAGEAVVGDIMTAQGKTYAIRYLGQGVHSLREIDQSKFAPEGQPDEPKIKPRNPKEGDTCSTDPPTEIDVLVVYTDDARAAAGGTDAMEAEVYQAVAVANETYLNSGVTQRLRLVHVAEVNYAETGDSFLDRNRLQNGGDGFLDNVHALRDTYAADLVALIVESNVDYCGYAFIMNPVSNAFEDYGYAVVIRSCASANYTFGHELGHIMGARHNWATDSTDNSPYHYNHGHFNLTPTSPATPWRTVMATSTDCLSCTRLPYWSNPDLNYPPGDPLGVNGDQPTDNRQTLNNTALTVANFRCSSPTAGNVWMKDTWKDTGVEPDPLTAGQDMWKSPYIWIRNTQDAALLHQHQHQNPEFGSTNWIYVKLHNGGAMAANGNLELYYANASTGLSWPADWTLLTTVPINGFASHSTHIAEVQWDNLPGVGHYCMLARWVSGSDPMTHPETSNINSNVRNNNNLVWRNLNIVDLSGDPIADASFIVRNSTKDRAVTILAIRPPENELQESFILKGKVTFRLDSSLLKAWQIGGMKGSGFAFDGNEFLVTSPAGAVLENILLEGLQTGRARLTFTRLASTPKRQFMIDAVQLKPGPGPAVIGGVSYTIHTDKILE